ncbi:MAG: 4-hydroxy-3-methylbut-2-enyl diphosphate reductase [Spirochaetales bacterium]|nr:MAG: 4-hydroxy-3-methylbut-2-enyl diphosphate reductase [Spirochaetales bacterium]
MLVYIPNLSGFCPGVKHAEQKIFEEKYSYPHRPIFLYGYMINNRSYIEYLDNHDIHTTEQPWDLPADVSLVIRTHGIDRVMEEKLRKKYYVIDLTCRNVKKVQNKIREESESGSFIVITGKKTHPEVLGLISYADHYIIVEHDEDLAAFSASLKENPGAILGTCSRVFITSQTTGDVSLFNNTLEAVAEVLKNTRTLSFFNSICPMTTNKELEALEIQKKVDLTFVLGDTLSSNANKLFRILKGKDSNTFLVQDLAALKKLGLDLTRYSAVQVVSSASTPGFIEEEVVTYLKGI